MTIFCKISKKFHKICCGHPTTWIGLSRRPFGSFKYGMILTLKPWKYKEEMYHVSNRLEKETEYITVVSRSTDVPCPTRNRFERKLKYHFLKRINNWRLFLCSESLATEKLSSTAHLIGPCQKPKFLEISNQTCKLSLGFF